MNTWGGKRKRTDPIPRKDDNLETERVQSEIVEHDPGIYTYLFFDMVVFWWVQEKV